MVIDGRSAGKGMAVDLIREAFAALAADFAAVDHKAALEALGRIELTIADALAEFRLQTGQGTVPYVAAFDAMLEVVSSPRNARQTQCCPAKSAHCQVKLV
jgi:hypothetical protein